MIQANDNFTLSVRSGELTQAESAELERRRREERREEQLVVREFVHAVKHGDRAALVPLLAKIDDHFLWRRAFRALARKIKNAELDPEMRAAWVRIWTDRGDHLRQEADKGPVLIRALRSLLPPYTGPALTLYRGASAWNRYYCTYGLSWSGNQTVATGFAEGYWRKFRGGSVLLSTVAPAEAIICAPSQHDARYIEDEYLVDRRRLKHVTVLQHYSQVDIKQSK